jgi:predicted nucleic acid-binding protein
VQAVVSDTGPLHYLVLIEAIGVLPQLFSAVVIPASVRRELDRAETPETVRRWIATPPAWLQVRAVRATGDALPRTLHPGERDAIALALRIRADLLLMDDRARIAAARKLGLAATGTLGLLAVACEHGLVALDDAFVRLRATNFRYPPALMDALLTRFRKPGGRS